MNDKKSNNNTIRYLKVKHGMVSEEYTDDFISMMKNEYDYFFDTAEYLFDRHPDIRVFVKEESLFSERPSVYYYRDSELLMTFGGTVFFAKLGKTKVRSLTKKEMQFLLKNLKRNDHGIYRIDAES